jgi:DNA-binding NarL/FixJ family response regulator
MPATQTADPRLGTLTRRERQVLELVAGAASNAAIAEHLGVSTRAVERHINSIFLKLQLGDSNRLNRRVQAALLYTAAA